MSTRKLIPERVLPGCWIRVLAGDRAFCPDPLPPALVWSDKLVRALSDADQLLGRLAGEGRRLPNPHVVIRPFVRREAVLSSRIEGTQATLGELLAAEAGAVVSRSLDDLLEVSNYVVALEHGMERLKTLPLCLRLVREVHEKLMRGVRGDHATPGEFRRSQNWIGLAGCTLQDVCYVPPPPDAMMDCLGAWEKFLHDRSLPPLVQIALAHYQFEAIHPFLDGNGRVGRLLITLFLIEREILPSPLLYVSAFFEATRRDYYDGLSAVSERGDWSGWLEYSLRAVSRQSEDALSRARRINQQLETWRNMVAGSRVPLLVVELLAANPFLTVRHVQRDLKTSYNTAARAIAVLEGKGIVQPVSDAKRDRAYCARAILEILEEPARLVPEQSQ